MSTARITAKKKEKYLASPNHCPFCGSKEIESCESPSVDDGGCTQHIGCLKCKREWYDIYYIIDVEEVFT